MKQQYGIYYFTILVFCSSSLDTLASSWLRTSGESLFQAGISNSRSSDYWDKNRSLNDSCDSKYYSTNLHYEYGYSYYHSLFGATRIEHNSCDNYSSKGIPNIELGVRGRLNKFKNGRTWELSAIIPIQGNSNDSSKPGNGEFGIVAGIFISPKPDPYLNPFTSRKGGSWTYGLKGTFWMGDEAHEIEGRVNWKHPLFDTQWSFAASLRGSYSFGASQDIGFDPQDQFRSIDKDKISGRLRFSRRLDKSLSISLSIGQDFWGRNTSRGSDIRFSISRIWD